MIKKEIVRREKIRYLLMEIDESITIIRDYVPESEDFDDFIILGIVKDGIYKRLEYVLQSIFDICVIINRDLTLGIPQNDDDIIKNLVTAGIIENQMGELLKDMKGMRNILVHQYGKINDDIIFHVITTQLDDISSISNHFRQVLDTYQNTYPDA